MLASLISLASVIISAPSVNSATLQSVPGSPNIHSLSPLSTNTTFRDVRKPLSAVIPLCDGGLGDHLDPASCRNALRKIPEKPGPFTFGERDTGAWEKTLPIRFLSDNGKCAIDISIDEESLDDADVTTYGQLSIAATAIIDQCVSGRVFNIGGFVEGLGFGEALVVGVEKYEPLVTCQDVGQQPAPSYDSCKEIIDKMPWSPTKTLFGTAGQPGVEVIVPETLKSNDGRCNILIHGASPCLETATWAGIWADIIAVNELCVKHGKQGSSPLSSGKPDTLKFSLSGTLPRDNLDILPNLNLTVSEFNGLPTVNMSGSRLIKPSLNRTRLVKVA